MFITQVFVICFVLLKAISCKEQTFKGDSGIEFLMEDSLEFTWADAKAACEEKNSTLVTIQSRPKKNYALGAIDSQFDATAPNMWLGAFDPLLWVNDNKSTSMDWLEDINDKLADPQQCAYIKYFSPNVAVCNQLMGFVCEKIP